MHFYALRLRFPFIERVGKFYILQQVFFFLFLCIFAVLSLDEVAYFQFCNVLPLQQNQKSVR